METFVIDLPEDFSSKNIRIAIESMRTVYKQSFSPRYEEVTFNFKKCRSFSSAGLIFICTWRDALNNAGKKTYYRESDKTTDSFLKRMHLLPSSGITEDKAITEKYFYQIHRCTTINECSNAHKEILSNVVQREELSEKTYCAIDYMLNELWDNAGVHGYECYSSESYPKPVYICALEEDSCYEVCIGDLGQGIYSSLHKNNASIMRLSNKDSVKAAVQNGISGHPKGSPGFGLYSASEFIKGGNGELHIWSSGCYLCISAKNEKIYNSIVSTGTLVSFVINKSAILPFDEVLNGHSVSYYDTQNYLEDMIGGIFDER